MEFQWSGKMGKVGGSEIRCVFSSCKYSKTRFSGSPDPAGGAYAAPPGPLVGWGGGYLIPFPQLLQPQLLNNWLSGLTLFFINMTQRLLTISVNTRYRVIFACACLYWKSRGISCGLESGHPASYEMQQHMQDTLRWNIVITNAAAINSSTVHRQKNK